MPTLIERQDRLVATLVTIHRRRLAECCGRIDGMAAGQRSRAKRLHIEEMRAAGYTQREAADSASQCDDVACLIAAHEHADGLRVAFDALLAAGFSPTWVGGEKIVANMADGKRRVVHSLSEARGLVRA